VHSPLEQGESLMLQETDLASFAAAHGIEFIAQFGSQARGTARPDSDFDLALMPECWDDDRHLEADQDLARLLGSAVDTTWLPDASWLLAYNVARDGQVLYEKQSGEFKRFVIASHLRAGDAALWRRLQLQGLRRAVQKDSTMDKLLVQDKLARLMTSLRELRIVLDVPRDVYEQEFMRYRTAERNLEMLIEYAATINAEVASAAGIPPSDYYSSFFSAADAGAIDRSLAMKLADVARLRNVVIHAYEKIDVGATYERLKASLSLWDQYAEGILRRLD
jgi:uncharacterized protein YutE (UPF0331/DUF86 family)/predicted nucleotidyltransferase